jgi:YD repeat-containing protein
MMKKVGLFVLIMGTMFLVGAQRRGAHRVETLPTLLDDIALNAAAGTRTFSINNPDGGYAIANLELARTRNAGTDMTMTCVATTGSGTPTAQRTTCTYDGAGTCASVTATMSSSTSVTETLAWVVGIHGWVTTNCVVASTSADGDDKLTVTGNMVAQ